MHESLNAAKEELDAGACPPEEVVRFRVWREGLQTSCGSILLYWET